MGSSPSGSVSSVVLYALKARQTSPQALLVMCNAISYILLALCMALLTIAPDYTAFGSQTVAVEGSGTPRHCTLSRRENGAASCQISVIAAFFGRIAVAMPFFSVAYFFANWAFIGKFCVVFILGLFCQQRQPFTDTAPDGDDEEEIGLLAFN
ncbi:unnamed protein product [Polarella glacialis]|uniref:Uncharacterized protein n=1 Tax=Polarella glacialis TaxID=89957 RepID=A0A813FQC3_POLGL|nr:unnamed protein product [Polarella glacialis]